MRKMHLSGLQLRVALMRMDWITILAGMVCALGIVGWLWLMPHLHAQATMQQHALRNLQQSLQSVPADPVAAPPLPAEQRLLNFYAALGETGYSEQQIKTLFAIANKTGLVLDKAEYKPGRSQGGHYRTYQIILPVKGSYTAIRRFCEQVLLAIPFASLDEMSFKRDAIASNLPEARLRFTLYLSDGVTGVHHARDSDGYISVVSSGRAPAILALQPRDLLIGGAHATGQNRANLLFGSQNWTPPPPPLPKPPLPPPPTAPSLPFVYLGKKIEDGKWEVYLARGEQTLIVHDESVIEGTYRVESIRPPTLTFTYLPLHQVQTLTIEGND